MGVVDKERIDIPQHKGNPDISLEANLVLVGESDTMSTAYVSISKNNLFVGNLRFDWILGRKVVIAGYRYKVESYFEDDQNKDLLALILSGKKRTYENLPLYYYPDPEDIRIGMECEVNFNVGYEHRYDKVTVDAELIQSWDFWESNCRVRVPLFTRDQVLSLGWEEIEDNNVVNIYHINPIGRQQFDIIIGKGDLWAVITRIDGEHRSICYEGPCPTINHLKDIMRLLNIKKDDK